MKFSDDEIGIMTLSTEHLRRCIETLETAFDGLHRHEGDPVMCDVFRAACVNGERFAETTLKLLPAFIADAKALADAVKEPIDD